MSEFVSNRGGPPVGAEDFLAAVLRTVAQPVWVVDHDGLIRYANPAAAKVLGYDGPAELYRLPSHETIHHMRPDGAPFPVAECPMLLPRTTGETVSRELDWFVRRDGSLVAVSYVSVPLDLPSGRGVVVAFSDVAARRDALERLRAREVEVADELSSLRRVATLTAGGASSGEVFDAIVREVARVVRLPMVIAARFDSGGDTMTILAETSDRPHRFRAGTRWTVDSPSLAHDVLRTGRSARLDSFDDSRGAIRQASIEAGLRGIACAPIVVDGRVWGMMAAASTNEQWLPDRIEDRLTEFTGLVATAISNSQARDELRRLADEQAALRRVATRVAEGATPGDVFTAVSQEVSRIMGLPVVSMYRFEPDGTATVAGATGEHPFQAGTNWPLDSPTLPFLVRESGRPATMREYQDVSGAIGESAEASGVEAGVAAPIIVDGRLWGAVSACTNEREPIPADAGRRLSRFTALVATAISNTQAREDLRLLADEQAALRRLATLVARGVESQVVFDAVCEETGRLLGASSVNLLRFTSAATSLAGWTVHGAELEASMLSDDAILRLIRDSAAPARREDGEAPGIRSEVGAPVVVEGKVWGALITGAEGPEPLPPGTEQRLSDFAELIATAVSNAEARAELVTSRVRIVEAADEQRRQVVRDLHDGAQQRLVHTIVTLQLARRELGRQAPAAAAALLEEALANAQEATNELRELAHGILPSGLISGGLRAGLTALASRACVPVGIDVTAERFPASIEATAYFVVAEALTNVAKHSRARAARVTAGAAGGTLRIEVRDDGVGGAKLSGPGLVGMRDRLGALGGVLRIHSPPGGGTVINARIPLPA